MMTQEMGNRVKVIGKGLRTKNSAIRFSTMDNFSPLTAFPEREPFDGDPLRFRLGVEGMRLGLVYEYEHFKKSSGHRDPGACPMIAFLNSSQLEQLVKSGTLDKTEAPCITRRERRPSSCLPGCT
jgi:hypothetical protein